MENQGRNDWSTRTGLREPPGEFCLSPFGLDLGSCFRECSDSALRGYRSVVRHVEHDRRPLQERANSEADRDQHQTPALDHE
jgi:hypothetical protein